MLVVRYLLGLAVIAALALGAVYFVAGRMAGPAIAINQPQKFVGQAGTLDVAVDTPDGKLDTLEIRLEQEGRSIPLGGLGDRGAAGVTFAQESPTRIRVTGPLGRRSVPELRPGAGRIVVTASRPVLFGLRSVGSSATRDVTARFDPPRLAVLSTHHYVNHGGSEMVVLRVSPPDVEAVVRAGEVTYPSFPASGAGVPGDAGTRVAFFALLHDQDLAVPVAAVARDEAGNEARATLPDYRPIAKPFRRSRIDVEDAFMNRVVPAILSRAPQADAPGDIVADFLKINGDLRRANAETIRSMAAKTAPRLLWNGAFQQLGNSQVESSFADHRTYYYKGREIDQQVHLGFDLAVTANVPVTAANDGTVVHADDLGIYGNTVILDHGLGVQSLYAHLNSFDVKVGDTVRKGQTLGRSGMTGLAGGDHLHFTMLVGGHPVTPVDWWDQHWIDDRIMRKLREAGRP